MIRPISLNDRPVFTWIATEIAPFTDKRSIRLMLCKGLHVSRIDDPRRFERLLDRHHVQRVPLR